MMLRHTFGLETEARAVESAVSGAIDDGCVTVDIAPRGARSYSTEEVGRKIALLTESFELRYAGQQSQLAR
jgi:3-isopropylmalate dehydrogenase